jgi:DHA1 family bicyclomycin/chloramphenicol resistance-like MFS transporter
MFTYIAMGTFVLQQVYGLSPQAFAVVFGANALGIVALSQVGGVLVGRVGPRALLTAGVLLALAAAVALLVGVLASDSVWAVLPPLWVLVGCTGLIGPNATALALAEQGHAAGTASAVIGLVQFGLGAIIPPVASLGGVTPLVMVWTMLATAVLAAVVHVLGNLTRTPSRTTLS